MPENNDHFPIITFSVLFSFFLLPFILLLFFFFPLLFSLHAPSPGTPPDKRKKHQKRRVSFRKVLISWNNLHQKREKKNEKKWKEMERKRKRIVFFLIYVLLCMYLPPTSYVPARPFVRLFVRG